MCIIRFSSGKHELWASTFGPVVVAAFVNRLTRSHRRRRFPDDTLIYKAGAFGLPLNEKAMYRRDGRLDGQAAIRHGA